MWKIEKSALFKRQLLDFAQNYKDRVNAEAAGRFVDAIGDAIQFVHKKPLACALYREAKKHQDLKHHTFRKWSVTGFPHSIFFRITDDKTIRLEAIYAHRMNTIMKMSSDIKS